MTQTDLLTSMNKTAQWPPVENQPLPMADPMADPTKMTELMMMSRIGTRGMMTNPTGPAENRTT
jgi:hypothetical protein